MAKEFGYTNIYIRSLIKLADTALSHKNYPKARDLYLESIRMCNKQSDKHKLALSIKGLGNYYLQTQNFQTAAKLFGAAANLFKSVQVKLPEETVGEWNNKLNELNIILGANDFTTHFTEGESMGLDKVVEYVESVEQVELV